MRRLLTNLEIFDIFCATFPPREPISMKFCVAKRTHIPLGHAIFHMNRCKNAEFWPLSKFNTGSLTLRSILSVIKMFRHSGRQTAYSIIQYLNTVQCKRKKLKRVKARQQKQENRN